MRCTGLACHAKKCGVTSGDMMVYSIVESFRHLIGYNGFGCMSCTFCTCMSPSEIKKFTR